MSDNLSNFYKGWVCSHPDILRIDFYVVNDTKKNGGINGIMIHHKNGMIHCEMEEVGDNLTLMQKADNYINTLPVPIVYGNKIKKH